MKALWLGLRREADLGTRRIHIWADLVFTKIENGAYWESTTLTSWQNQEVYIYIYIGLIEKKKHLHQFTYWTYCLEAQKTLLLITKNSFPPRLVWGPNFGWTNMAKNPSHSHMRTMVLQYLPTFARTKSTSFVGKDSIDGAYGTLYILWFLEVHYSKSCSSPSLQRGRHRSRLDLALKIGTKKKHGLENVWKCHSWPWENDSIGFVKIWYPQNLNKSDGSWSLPLLKIAICLHIMFRLRKFSDPELLANNTAVLLLHLSPLKIWRIPSHQNLWEVVEVATRWCPSELWKREVGVHITPISLWLIRYLYL